MLELTVPSESGVTDAHTRKQEKYAELVESCRSAQWKVLLRPVEVGVLGHIAVSMQKTCSEMGIWCKDLKEALSETALRCSYAISSRESRPPLRQTGECGYRKEHYLPITYTSKLAKELWIKTMQTLWRRHSRKCVWE
jgi:hypothetical protein